MPYDKNTIRLNIQKKLKAKKKILDEVYEYLGVAKGRTWSDKIKIKSQKIILSLMV